MNRATHIAVKQKKTAANAPAADDDNRTPKDADDYEAIEQAVMATARGRWFLSEYLRRHQNDETKRLVKALRKLASVSLANEDVARYRAVLEQERAALDGIRLLLARTADAITPDADEPTLPEAAASRMAEITSASRATSADSAPLLKHLQEMFHALAQLLAEPVATAADRPDTTVQVVSADAATSHSPSHPDASSPQQDELPSRNAPGTARQTRIVIRKHESSAKVDIPLPERQETSAHGEADARSPRKVVRIRKRAGNGKEK